MSSPPSLLRAFTTVGGYTLMSRVAGFVRDTLISTFLGAGRDADAFFIAQQFPNLFRSLFAEGAFSAGFVPIFSQTLEKEGPEKAKQFADESFSVLSVVLLLFCALMMIIMPLALYVMAPGFDRIPGQMERTTELARVAFPYLLFVSLTSLQSGVLNSFHRFAVPAAAPVLANITLIAALLIGVGTDGDRAMFLSWGIFVTGIVQFVWLWLDCRRIGVGFKLVRPRLTPNVKKLITRTLPVVFGAGIYQINLVVNKTIASFVGAGAVSWLYYADRVNLLPVGIFGTAIGIALLPLLTRQIHAGEDAAAMSNQNRAIEVSLLLTVPSAAGIAMLAGPITSVLFEHGVFTPTDRVMVAQALLAFSFGLPAYVLNKALTPGFFARHDTKTPVKASAVALVVNIALNVGLAPYLGHVGIALGTSISAWLNAGLLAWSLRKRSHLVMDARLKRRIPRLILATLVMMALLFGLDYAISSHFGAVFGAGDAPAAGNLLRVSMLVILIGVGAVGFGLAALLFGAAERSDLAQLRRKRAA